MSDSKSNLSLSSRALTIERLFRTTITPSQHSLVSQYLVDAEAEIKRHEIQIDKLRSSIVLLENKRSNLSKKAVKYRTLLSPVHRIPPEVLEKVFSFACEGSTLQTDLIPPPILLSGVCGRWRDITLAMPSLWTSVHIISLGEWAEKKRYKHLLHRVQYFLERSKKSPLDLVLDFSFKFPHRDAVPILAALVSQATRWQRLTLQNTNDGCLRHPVFCALEQLGLPMLTHLAATGSFADDTAQECQLFSHCPSLTSLVMTDGGPLSIRDNLPWRQIKTLQTFTAYESSGLGVVAQCPNVEQLTLRDIGGISEGGPFRGEHINYPVKELSVRANTEDEVTCIFKNSTLHELSYLEIQGRTQTVWNLSESGQNIIIDFFTRSACSLTSLTLTKLPISDTQTIYLLSILPTLTSLHIEEQCRPRLPINRIITPSFLDRLSDVTNMDTRPFLPALARIKFLLHAQELDIGALSRALSSRWVPDSEYASELGISCIQLVDIVFVEKGQHVEHLKSSLGWMSRAGAFLYVSNIGGAT
ncbi:hypothetical protein VNI00_005996 [Paramarasmius palmivorus]|uniref:F-box domain-containing protein n=1 Tax=Paramarasmius palmivorus TaxID=297713 RepID=A0AAW0DAF9_9AGAR